MSYQEEAPGQTLYLSTGLETSWWAVGAVGWGTSGLLCSDCCPGDLNPDKLLKMEDECSYSDLTFMPTPSWPHGTNVTRRGGSTYENTLWYVIGKTLANEWLEITTANPVWNVERWRFTKYLFFNSVWPKTNDSVHEVRIQTESRFLRDVYSLFAIAAIAPWWPASRMQVFKHQTGFITATWKLHLCSFYYDCGTLWHPSMLLSAAGRESLDLFFIVMHADVSESHLYHLISTIK